MKLRPLSCENDVEQIIALQEEWVVSGLLPDSFNRLSKDLFSDQTTIVAESNGTTLGYCVFFEKCGHYEIDSVYVASDYRSKNKGLGKELIEAAECTIKARGGERIELCPMTTNNKAKLIRYYQDLGYVLDNCIMEKNI